MNILTNKVPFVDVEIEWNDVTANMPLVNHPCRTTMELRNVPLNIPLHGWVLSGYVYKSDIEDEKGNDFHPMRFYISGRKVQEKATHARFVKVGE